MKLANIAAAAIGGLLSLALAGAALAQDAVRRGPTAGATASVGDLAIGKQSTGPLQVGKVAVFRLQVRNGGSIAMGPGVQVTDTLSSDFTAPITASGPGWTCTVSGQTVTCQYVGPPIGARNSFPPITITAKAAVAGPYTNCAVVLSSTVTDGVPGNNQMCVNGNLSDSLVVNSGGVGPRSVGAGGPPTAGSVGQRGPVDDRGPGPDARAVDLSLIKRSLAPVVAGQLSSFSLLVTNNGPGLVNAGSGVQVVDTLPAGFTGPVTWAGVGWNCITVLPTVTCSYSGPPIPPGQTLPTLTITARAGAQGTYVNCAVVSIRRDRDTRPGNDRSCLKDTVLPGKQLYDVLIRKSGPGPITQGQTATFTLSPYNTGPSPVTGGTGITVTDLLPAGFGVPTVSALGWTCSVSGSGPYLVTCNLTATTSFGPSTPLPVITINTVAIGPPGGFSNCAEIRIGKATDVRPADNRFCIGGEIRPKPPGKVDVRILKDGPTGPVTAGGNALFTLVPFNDGPATVTSTMGLVVTDTLPINFVAPVIVNGGSNWTCVVTGAVAPFTVTCTYIGGPAAGGSPLGPITIQAKAAGVGQWTNCAFIGFRTPSGNITPGADTQPTDNRSCMDGKIVQPANYNVGITKTGPGALTVGQTATFTLNPTNVGPTPVNAASGVVVTDLVPNPPFSGTAAITTLSTAWNCSASSGLSVSCTYIGGNITGPMPPIIINVLVSKAGSYSNCARITLTQVGPDTAPGNNQSCVKGPVSDPKPIDVSIRKEGPTSVTVGQIATFTLRPNNDGPAPIAFASNMVVTDTLPANFGAPVLANNLPNWNCIVGTTSPFAVKCFYIGPPVLAGNPFPPITITAMAVSAGGWTNCASVGFTQPGGAITPGADTQPGDNRSCIKGEVVKPRPYNVGITKTGPGALTVGQTATFTLNPANVGPTPVNAASGVVVTDNLPNPPFSGTATVNGGPNWNCSASSGLNVSCTYVGANITGPMPPITITVLVSKAGSYVNCARIALTQVGPDTNLGNNQSCVEGPVSDPKPINVSIRKSGPSVITAGQIATFTLAPLNNGPATITSTMNLAVTDTLPINFGTPVLANNLPNWNCVVTGSGGSFPPFTVTCDYVGPPVPASGAFPPITITAKAGAYGPWTNCAFVGFRSPAGNVTAGPDTQPSNNRSCINGEVIRPQPSYDLSLDKSLHSNAASYANGGGFNLMVTNLGPPLPAGSRLTVTDTLPPGIRVDSVLGGWSCTPTPPLTGPVTFSCSQILSTSLGTGQTTLMQTWFSFVGPQLPGYQNCATLAAYPTSTSTTPLAESNSNNNSDCHTVTLPPPPSPTLSLTKTLPTPCLNVSGAAVCTFVFTVTNTGTAPYSGPVSLTDTINYATANGTAISGVTGGWTCNPGAPSSCQGNVSLAGGASTSFSATFTTNGVVLPTQNCAQLAPLTAAQLSPPSCVPITYVSNTAPVLQIEKVVDQDCTGTPPDTHCKFMIRIFNTGPGAYTGSLTFTDLVTSFGTPTGNVSLVAPFPPGWTCTGSQPLTCTSGIVTLNQGGMIAVPLWMDIQPPIPPDANCATLTSAAGQPHSCVGMGPPKFDMSVDSNFIPVVGAAGFHDFAIYVNSLPAVLPGYQIKLNGSLTSAYGANTFSPLVVASSPGWTCAPTTWAAFQCAYTVPPNYTGGSIVLKLRTSYPSGAVGSAFNYTVTVTTLGNTDPNATNDTRSVNGTLF